MESLLELSGIAAARLKNVDVRCIKAGSVETYTATDML